MSVQLPRIFPAPRSRIVAVTVVVALGLGLGCAPDASAAGCAATKAARVAISDSIRLRLGPEVPETAARDAIALWGSCRNYGRGFPELRVEGAADGELHVTLVQVGTGGRCGSFRGRDVTLYRFTRDPRGRLMSCGELGHNLAHEIGHALGLRDAASGPACARQIMAPIARATMLRRDVTESECQLVGQRWVTRGEQAALVGVGPYAWAREPGDSR